MLIARNDKANCTNTLICGADRFLARHHLMRTGDRDPSRAVARGLQRGVYKPHAFHALPNSWHEERIRVRRTFFDPRGDLFGEIRVKLSEGLQVSTGMS